MRSGCRNFRKKIIAVLIILLRLMAEALNESEDKYFSNKADILTRDILCPFIPEVIRCNDVPHQDCVYMHMHGK